MSDEPCSLTSELYRDLKEVQVAYKILSSSTRKERDELQKRCDELKSDLRALQDKCDKQQERIRQLVVDCDGLSNIAINSKAAATKTAAELLANAAQIAELEADI